VEAGFGCFQVDHQIQLGRQFARICTFENIVRFAPDDDINADIV
jgi:hypothetical protein